ncbi:hypothetical protein [Nitrosomonas sp. wSCUT-2]
MNFRKSLPLTAKLKQSVHRLDAETFALYLAVRHPDTPWYAKLLVALVIASFQAIEIDNI